MSPDTTRSSRLVEGVMDQSLCPRTEVKDPLYWMHHPMDTSTVICLLYRSQGRLENGDRRFETAFLIAEGCLWYPSLEITEKGKDALRWHLHGSPLIKHLDEEQQI